MQAWIIRINGQPASKEDLELLKDKYEKGLCRVYIQIGKDTVWIRTSYE